MCADINIAESYSLNNDINLEKKIKITRKKCGRQHPGSADKKDQNN